MVDMQKLSPAALKAAMQGGTDAWGQIGSATENVRYAEPIVPKSRKKWGIRKSGLKRDQSSPASIMRMSVEMSAP